MFFCGFGFVCFLSMFTRSTIAVPLIGLTRSTFACLPRSLPASTRTVSPFRTCGFCRGCSFCFLVPAYMTSDHLGRKRNDLHELPLAQLARDGTEDARSHRLVLIVDQHRGVVVELDVRPVATPMLFDCADDDRLHDGALLHGAVRRRFLHRRGDDVADVGVAAGGRAAEHLDRRNFFRAGVVGHVQNRSHLNHDFSPSAQCPVPSAQFVCPTGHWALTTGHFDQLDFSTTSLTFQRLRRDSGRVSSITTRSPTLRLFSSLCARNLLVRLMYF